MPEKTGNGPVIRLHPQDGAAMTCQYIEAGTEVPAIHIPPDRVFGIAIALPFSAKVMPAVTLPFQRPVLRAGGNDVSLGYSVNCQDRP